MLPKPTRVHIYNTYDGGGGNSTRKHGPVGDPRDEHRQNTASKCTFSIFAVETHSNA